MPAGRPKKQIDQQLFEDMCEIQCTKEEIANCLRVSQSTLERWLNVTYKTNFEVIYKKLSANGKQSLRRCQFALAKTNATMAIFLGKQYLGQRDFVENNASKDQLSQLVDALNKVAK